MAAALALGTAAHAATITVAVVDREGKPVPEAVVVLSPSAGGQPRTPLPGHALVVQQKMQFLPAVTLLPAGGRVMFVNEDSWEHHVRGTAAGIAELNAAPAHKGFELRLDGKSAGKEAKTAEVTLDRAGAMLLGCHLHGSMRGHIYVADSPWAAKTSPDGQAVFDDVPAGAVRVRVWHAEQLIDLPVQTASPAEAAPARLNFQLQVVPRRRRT
ncbi:conserved hypothetical protein [Ramlibacter tataouinensis TTB310]|uniref:Plastocyanin n=1 Tax=Ramlibacter tataouinensis (strain ATCC BAA-407 / DSM 14655 / LMG 21543 / TTB310) TaxID=365046 RepID=F5Y6C3_RAMTT|nr:conserved hypothetical protein [Ramlibacter tataouinensis TTB310]